MKRCPHCHADSLLLAKPVKAEYDVTVCSLILILKTTRSSWSVVGTKMSFAKHSSV